MVQVEKGSASSGLITTSHSPSHFLRKLSKLLTFFLLSSVRLNRGSLNKKQLLNYCWNNKIPRLIIVQGLEKKDSARIELFNLEKSQKPVNSVIEVTDVFFPRKGVKNTRIDVKNICLNYSKDIPQNIREYIDIFMKPFLNSNPSLSQDSDLEINITTHNSNQVLGKIIWTGRKEAIEILTFGITNLE
jgi:rRNA maturation protein Rpf1